MFNRFFNLFRRSAMCRVPLDDNAPWQSEEHGELDPLARMLVLVKPKQPYVRWMRELYKDLAPTLVQCCRDSSLAFLIPSIDGEIAEAEHFVATYWRHFFAQMLSACELSPATWPQDRTLAMFRHWFDVELGDMVLDLGGYPE